MSLFKNLSRTMGPDNSGHLQHVFHGPVGVACISLHCVSKKRHPFYFCDIFVKLHPILLIVGTNVPQEI